MLKTGGVMCDARTSLGVATTAGLISCAGILNKKKGHRMWTRMKKVSWKDEQPTGGMVFDEVLIGPPEFADPAILVVKDSPKYRYTKEELLKLKEVPLSKKKPDFINAECVPPSIWDPERWNDHKKSATPTEGGGSGKGDAGACLQPDGRRGRPGDPRERIRKENDGIVLSPQRRSFNTGCFVPVRDQPPHNGRPTRNHSPVGGAKSAGGGDSNALIGGRDVPSSNNRRIGSGRILRDSWDFNDKNDGGDNDYYRSQDDRRSFRRDFDMSRDKDKQQQRNSIGRYGNRRISGGERDEEPEWFSGGPVSQNDTIELRGFEESDRGGSGNKKKPLSSSQAKRVREWAKKKGSISEEKPEDEVQAENGQKPQNQVDKKGVSESDPKKTQEGNVSKKDVAEKDREQQNDNDKENRQNQNASGSGGGMEIINESSFIFDDIFKCDTIPGLLSNGDTATTDNNTKSKFSRWFKRESPDKAPTDSRRSSLHEEHLLKNLLNDINDPSVAVNIPQLGSSESYFAPISPAAVNAAAGEPPGNPKPAATGGQVNIADMFMRGGKAFGGGGGGGKAAQQHQKEVLNNIKTQFPGKVMSLNELESNMRKGLDISANQNANKHNMIKKEEEIAAFKKLLAQVSGGPGISGNGANHQKMPAMSIMEMLTHSQQQDEAQARLNAQKSLLMGPASPKTPSMNPLQTEFLLKLQQEQQAHLHRHQQQQQANILNKLMGLHTANPHLRSSPLQELAQQQSKELLSRPEAQAILQAMHQRIPSPRELQVHTQSILQRALIKKRLEEQQVNFRKKQEMQQMPNNASNKNMSSPPTPLAFAPTSVLRKMTADKEDAGRPIVKANAGYHNTGPEQFFSVQQQFLFNQSRQQQAGQQISGQFGQHQKAPQTNAGGRNNVGGVRKEDDSSSSTSNNNSSAGGGVSNSATTTTANQLSRWFSSDLLERARVGELPSTAGLAEHAVSLEEIERQSAAPVHN